MLKPLTEEGMISLLHKALEKDDWLKEKKIELKETDALIRLSGGDARKLLNLLELVVDAAQPTSGKGKGSKGAISAEANTIVITNEVVLEVAQQRIALYDKTGEQHYDIISAFIKSMRGSDPNGAIYWLARMIEGGEDVKFIARRMVIFASEDIGNANPTALVLANAAFEAVNKIGSYWRRLQLTSLPHIRVMHPTWQ